jgi:hypothetical protein
MVHSAYVLRKSGLVSDGLHSEVTVGRKSIYKVYIDFANTYDQNPRYRATYC